jgi:hypothetical protein
MLQLRERLEEKVGLVEWTRGKRGIYSRIEEQRRCQTSHLHMVKLLTPTQILVVLTGCNFALNSNISLNLPQTTLLSSVGHGLGTTELQQ